MKTAIILGGTGLVGNALIHQLLENPEYDQVISLHRRKIAIDHVKFQEFLIDFDHLEKDKKFFQGDVLFSSLGTTIKTAGSQEAQYKIDYTYPLEAAKLALENGVKEYVLVSSAGANSNSRTFYTRMKGELEDSIKQLSFDKIRIVQPSFLDGNRTETRIGEKIGIVVFKALAWIPFIKKYRPIHVDIVAKAMQNALKTEENIQTIALEELFEIAEN